MVWQHPTLLLALWILPVVAGLLVYAHRKRTAAAKQFADPEMVARLMPPLQGPRPWVKGALLLTGLALLIVASARPRFGVYFENVSQRGVDLFVVLDVSRSMTAEDIAPNRLERAKSDIRDLLARLAGDRVGLVVFAGKPVVKVPLTTDHGFFRMVLDEVDTASAPRGGTLIGDAVRKAMEAMPSARDRDQAIVLITDGEDHDSYPQEAAKQAAAAGIKIFAVGLGDSGEGSRIPLRDERAGLQYLKHQGQEIWSRLDERLLKEMALATAGAYIPARTRAYDLGQVYEDHLAGLNQGEIRTEKRKRFKEQFQVFVCLGVTLVLLEMAIPSYRRSAARHGLTWPARAAATAAAAAILIGSLPVAVSAGAPEAEVTRGIRHFQDGDFPQALSAFREADIARPEDPRIAFNLATAHAATGDAEKAESLYQQAALARDQGLAARCRYNLGTLAAAKARGLFGDQPEQAAAEVRQQGLALLGEAVANYRTCLELDANHADARHNLEVIRLWLKNMEALWDQRDRQKRRQQMNLLELLAMLEAKERELRQTSRSVAKAADSPRRRQAIASAAAAQRQLQEEIEPLRQKITTSLQPPRQQGATPSTPPTAAADTQQAVELLTGLADRVGTAMLAAAKALDNSAVEDAVRSQTEAVEKLDQIYMGVVPFPPLLERATGVEQRLVQQGADTVNGSTALPPDPAGQQPEEAEEQPEEDFGQAAWDQRFVAGWARMLGPKADQSLKQLETAAAAPPGGVAGAGGGQQPSTDPEAMRQQVEALKESMRKAVTLAPKVQQLAAEAADRLEQKQPDAALPRQQEALKLLEEIAEPLAKQNQEQQQRQPSAGQPGEQDDKQKSGQDQQRREPRQQDLSRQQAEAVLRRVRERQRGRRELQRQLQQHQTRPGSVEKDW